MKIVMLQSWWGVPSSWMKFQDSGPATEIKGFSLKGNGCNERNSGWKSNNCCDTCTCMRGLSHRCAYDRQLGDVSCEQTMCAMDSMLLDKGMDGLQLQVSSRSPVNMDSRVALQIGRPPSKSKRWVFGNPTRTRNWYGTNLIDINCGDGTSTAQRDWMWILLI